MKLKVNYNLSVEKLIEKGKYDYAWSEINDDNFPSDKKGIVEQEVEVVHFNRTMTYEEVISELKKQGKKPVDLKTLLHYALKIKNFSGWVYALASTWRNDDGYLYVPFVRVYPVCRIVYASSVEYRFYDHHGFLVSCESKPFDPLSLDISEIKINGRTYKLGLK